MNAESFYGYFEEGKLILTQSEIYVLFYGKINQDSDSINS